MTIEATQYTISLPLIARIKAQQFRVHQLAPLKSKQVYLNTLAVTAVNYYLNHLGWTTNLETSDSWNPVLQTMMDVADLDIPNYGKIECRCVLPNDDWITVPHEVRFQRIAYIAVKLNVALTEAQLLGFVPQVNSDKIAFSDLKSLAQLPSYLSQHRRAAIVERPTQLSKWLEGLVENNWQQLEELLSQSPSRLRRLKAEYFGSSMRLNFRSASKLKTQKSDNLFPGVSRVKLIDLEDPENNNIALILTVFAQSERELDISVKACSANYRRYLPQGLELVVLDTDKKPMMQAQANDTETIEFCFSGELGEYFEIEVSLDNYIKVEAFMV